MTKRRRYEFKSALVGAAKKYAYNTGKKYVTDYFSRRSSRRTTNRRRRGRRIIRRPRTVRFQAKMAKKVRKLEKCLVKTISTHIHRRRDAGELTSSAGEIAQRIVSCGGTKALIETAMANLRYFDPSTNTVVTANPTVGSYSREACVEIHRKLTVRNNYVVPVMVQIFSCIPKDATNISPLTSYSNGMADQLDPDIDSPLVFLSDCRELHDLWNLKQVARGVLKAGQTLTGVSHQKDFSYEFSSNDTHSLAYDKDQGGHTFIIRITGILGHDSALNTTQISTGECGVDWMCDVTFTFKYDAGKYLHDVSISDNTNAPTTSTIHGAVPIPDNVSYSTS